METHGVDVYLPVNVSSEMGNVNEKSVVLSQRLGSLSSS